MSMFIVFMMLLWAGIANAQYYQFSASGHVPPTNIPMPLTALGIISGRAGVSAGF